MSNAFSNGSRHAAHQSKDFQKIHIFASDATVFKLKFKNDFLVSSTTVYGFRYSYDYKMLKVKRVAYSADEAAENFHQLLSTSRITSSIIVKVRFRICL